MLFLLLNKWMQKSLMLWHKESKIYKLPFLFPWNPILVSHWDLNSGTPENRWWRPYLLADHSMGQCNLVWWCNHMKSNLLLVFHLPPFQINALFLSRINILFLFGLPSQTDLEQTKPTEIASFMRYGFGWYYVISNPYFFLLVFLVKWVYFKL